MTTKIRSFIAAGEGIRAKKLACAIAEDPRFYPLEINPEIPVDVLFRRENECYPDENFHAELKECADFVGSALGKDGHLYLQHLAMREERDRSMILVLGGDDEVSAAIRKSLVTRYRGQELAFQIANYEARLQDFEAQSFAMMIPVIRWKARPFSRLLSTAAKVLGSPTLMDYRPRPAEGECELCAACCLTRGIGPETWQNILREYQIGLVPRGDYAKPLEEIGGVGPKRCKQIEPMVRMIYR